MCFLLYAGTRTPLPRKEFQQDAPAISVLPLTDHDAAIKNHFSKPEVQYIGSTSGCGCDFPHAMFQSGGWPEIAYVQEDDWLPETRAAHRKNCETLVALLRTANEEVVELYGVWEGEYDAKAESREAIPLERILAADFFFKERGFYTVRVESA